MCEGFEISKHTFSSGVKVGGYKAGRLRAEMKNPALQARKLEPKTPSHAFCNQDFERFKSGVGSLNPCLEDGFPCLHRC